MNVNEIRKATGNPKILGDFIRKCIGHLLMVVTPDYIWVGSPIKLRNNRILLNLSGMDARGNIRIKTKDEPIKLSLRDHKLEKVYGNGIIIPEIDGWRVEDGENKVTFFDEITARRVTIINISAKKKGKQ